MTAPAIIRKRKTESLDHLLETLNSFDIDDEHVAVLKQAGTGQGIVGLPHERDALGNQAFTYRSLAALAEVVADQQERISQLEEALGQVSKKK